MSSDCLRCLVEEGIVKQLPLGKKILSDWLTMSATAQMIYINICHVFSLHDLVQVSTFTFEEIEGMKWLPVSTELAFWQSQE